MGMFDTIRSSYPLGDWHTGVKQELQTKSLDSFMDDYWISPEGELFKVEYHDCFTPIPSERHFGFDWEPTGNNGKVRASDYSGEIILYPARWEGSWEDWPEVKLFMFRGQIIFETLAEWDVGSVYQ